MKALSNRMLGLLLIAAAAGCGGTPPPSSYPPVPAIRFDPDTCVFQLSRTKVGDISRLVRITSSGVVPVVITGIDTDVSDGTIERIVEIGDSPDSCLHAITSLPPTTLAFKELRPGESCEVVLQLSKSHIGKGSLRIWSGNDLVATMSVAVAP